mmetsp:Transcript_99023/g.248290  ORF Transcript_99023/g.248290 Transcript_99023/m.248290 type:complete len:215 (+) Transcript_99023:304-948(+)
MAWLPPGCSRRHCRLWPLRWFHLHGRLTYVNHRDKRHVRPISYLSGTGICSRHQLQHCICNGPCGLIQCLRCLLARDDFGTAEELQGSSLAMANDEGASQAAGLYESSNRACCRCGEEVVLHKDRCRFQPAYPLSTIILARGEAGDCLCECCPGHSRTKVKDHHKVPAHAQDPVDRIPEPLHLRHSTAWAETGLPREAAQHRRVARPDVQTAKF